MKGILRCPICGCQGVLEQLVNKGGSLMFVVCCENTRIDKWMQNCALDIPPDSYWFNRRSEAIEFWNAQRPEAVHATSL